MGEKHWPFALMVVGGIGCLLVSLWLLVIGWFGSWMTEDDYSAAGIWGLVLAVVAVGLLGTGVTGLRQPSSDEEVGLQRPPAPASVSLLIPCPSCGTRYNAATSPSCPRCGETTGDG